MPKIKTVVTVVKDRNVCVRQPSPNASQSTISTNRNNSIDDDKKKKINEST